MDTAERAQHFAESISFVCCRWLQHLLPAADTIHVSLNLEKVMVAASEYRDIVHYGTEFDIVIFSIKLALA